VPYMIDQRGKDLCRWWSLEAIGDAAVTFGGCPGRGIAAARQKHYWGRREARLLRTVETV
jgi:hypothetical protein